MAEFNEGPFSDGMNRPITSSMPDLTTIVDSGTLDLQATLINTGLAAVLSLLLGWHYRRFGSTFSNRAKLAWVLPAVALPTVLVISVVKASIALSLGLVGALSIVRFRTPVKEPEELAYIFLSIAIGVGMGAGQRIATIAVVLLILFVLTLRTFLFRGSKYPNLYLNIRLAAHQAKEAVLKEVIEILQPHATNVELRRFDVTGGAIEGTFYLDCREIDHLLGLQTDLRERFPEADVTFVEQSGVPGA